MPGSSFRRWLKNSVRASRVPDKVEDPALLERVARLLAAGDRQES